MPRRIGSGLELLADPVRRHIIAIVAGRAREPSAIAREIGRSRPATSRQLGILVRAGILRRLWHPIDGRKAMYTIDPRAQAQVTAWLAGVAMGFGPDRPPGWLPSRRPGNLLEPETDDGSG